MSYISMDSFRNILSSRADTITDIDAIIEEVMEGAIDDSAVNGDKIAELEALLAGAEESKATAVAEAVQAGKDRIKKIFFGNGTVEDEPEAEDKGTEDSFDESDISLIAELNKNRGGT